MISRTMVVLVWVFALSVADAAESINVFLMAGQSNMLGRADLRQSADSTVLYHHGFRGERTLDRDGFAMLGIRPIDDGQKGNFGPELTFGQQVQEALPDQKIVILKHAVGGTCMYRDWHADGTTMTANDGVQFREFKRLVSASLAKLENDFPDAEIRVRGMLWHQGEADVGSAATQYKQNMQDFLHDLRADLDLPNLPVFVGGLSDLQRKHYERKDRLKWYEMIVGLQKELSAEDPKTWYVALDKADGMTIDQDGLHFDAAGYKSMGRRFADAYLQRRVATSLANTVDQTGQTLAYEISPRIDPSLTEQAESIPAKAWLSEGLKEKGVELIWVKSIWGKETQNWYNHWDEKIDWAQGVTPWYMTHPRIIWFKGQMYGAFTERSLPHGSGDTVIHLIRGETDWKSVVHFEVEGGLNSTHFVETSDGRLMFVGLRKGKGFVMVASFSEDGKTWSALEEFKTTSDQAPIGQIFKLAWHDGRAYGLSRAGQLWQSQDGINYDPIQVVEPADGYIGENETAPTFDGDRCLIFQRSGIVAESDPPYTHWKLNRAGEKGEHSHGGPEMITLPDGQVLAGSRGSGFPRLGSFRGGHMAVIFGYENGTLEPLIGLTTGGTMTGYPSMTWADGYLYVSYLRDGPHELAWFSAKGQFALAKIKWPLTKERGKGAF